MPWPCSPTSATTKSLDFIEAIPHTQSTNAAFQKTAIQSSTYVDYAGAERAVDGNRDSVWHYNASNSISHTSNDSNAWWEVDLDDVYHLDHVQLFDRWRFPYQLSNFFVVAYVGDDEVWRSETISGVSAEGGGSLRIDLPGGTLSDRVRIENDGGGRPLVIAECEVYTRGAIGLTGINSVTISDDGTRLYTTAYNGAVSVFARHMSGNLSLLYEISAGVFPAELSSNHTAYPDDRFTGPPDDRDGRNLAAGSSITFDFGSHRIFDRPGGDFNVYELDWGGPEFNSIQVEVSGDGTTYWDVTSTVGPGLSIPGDESHQSDENTRSYDISNPGWDTGVRYVRIKSLSVGFDLDAVVLLGRSPGRGRGRERRPADALRALRR